MKVAFARFLAFMFAFAPAIGFAALVVIDPGHGGKDQGVVHGNVKESGLVLAFAGKLEASLKAKGYRVTLTREGDSFVPVKDRALFISDPNPVVVISLHLSESKDPTTRGFRILSAKEDESGLTRQDRELPERLAAALGKLDPARPVQSGKLGKPVLNTPKALILELGYLSNDADRQLVQSEAYQKQVADIVAAVINDLH
jgi:N-acetylmuramoyl-L-alanine amidase